jgi:hypothetical protein
LSALLEGLATVDGNLSACPIEVAEKLRRQLAAERTNTAISRASMPSAVRRRSQSATAACSASGPSQANTRGRGPLKTETVPPRSSTLPSTSAGSTTFGRFMRMH